MASALLKASAPGRSRGALETFGVRGRVVATGALWLLVAVELGLGIGVVAGLSGAAYAAAALMVAFAAALVVALARGRRGRPCACLGPRSRVSPVGLVRNLVLAAGFAALPALPAGGLSELRWVEVGLVAALVGVGVLGVLVLALAREVAELRLSIGPQLALDIEDEGPPIGSVTALAARARPGRRAILVLAVFTSEGCPVCEALRPAVAEVARDPLVAVEVVEESAEPELWRELAIPGSPYAVVAGLDGVVLAKGTFNTLAQLQGLLAAAERRPGSTLHV